MSVTKIDKYEVMYSSNKFVPQIRLISGDKIIGRLIFRPNGSTLPADSLSGGQAYLYYHLDDYQNALDLLRNEGPMYVSYIGPSSENCIRTTEEAIGEGE